MVVKEQTYTKSVIGAMLQASGGNTFLTPLTNGLVKLPQVHLEAKDGNNTATFDLEDVKLTGSLKAGLGSEGPYVQVEGRADSFIAVEISRQDKLGDNTTNEATVSVQGPSASAKFGINPAQEAGGSASGSAQMVDVKFSDQVTYNYDKNNTVSVETSITLERTLKTI
jgi:hypothetical protein